MENKSIGVVFHVEFDGDVQKSVALQKSMVLSSFPIFFCDNFWNFWIFFPCRPTVAQPQLIFFSVPPDRGSATLEKIIAAVEKKFTRVPVLRSAINIKMLPEFLYNLLGIYIKS